jgi:hypothetical protein
MAVDPDALERRGRRAFWGLVLAAALWAFGFTIGPFALWRKIAFPLFMVGLAIYSLWVTSYLAKRQRRNADIK